MTLDEVLEDVDLCIAICNELYPDWRYHYLCDPILALSQLAMMMPESVMEYARDARP